MPTATLEEVSNQLAQEQEDRRWCRNERDRARCAAEIAEQRESGGKGIVPGVLLKLLVKDKLHVPHSREVPVNVKEWQLKPPRGEQEDYSRKVLSEL